MTKKIFLTIAQGSILLTMLSSIMLWATKIAPLRSQSAFADQENVIWYIFIHLGMILSFFILNATQGYQRLMYGTVAFASGFTLMFDMYGYKFNHDISTAAIFLLASYCIVAYEDKRRVLYGVICGILAVVFLFTFTGVLPLSVYWVETVIELVFGGIILLRIKDIKS